jgi:hypothetical protein
MLRMLKRATHQKPLFFWMNFSSVSRLADPEAGKTEVADDPQKRGKVRFSALKGAQETDIEPGRFDITASPGSPPTAW